MSESAEGILIARENHYPASISELYDPEKMPADLIEAHARNDEIIERIFSGRLMKNDTDRLEVLFNRYANKYGKAEA